MVLSEPQLALLRNNVEDFALGVHQVWVASFLPGFVDVELEERCGDEEDRCVFVGM